ncbi:MAG: hypothetical protein KME26_08250 [Oscillatoria princeps RMCB-10]|nr:hypothetical protein [Oscillatoria princeps RMCB-10]
MRHELNPRTYWRMLSSPPSGAIGVGPATLLAITEVARRTAFPHLRTIKTITKNQTPQCAIEF